MPPNAPRGGGGDKSTDGSAAHAIALGEFLGSARWLITPKVHAAPEGNFAPERPETGWKENFADTAQAQDTDTSDTELGPLLGAIADDVHRSSAAACAGIMADFAARAAYARRHLPRNQIAAALGAIAQARKAALALVKQNAARELAGRKKAAIATRRRPRRSGAPYPRKPSNDAPRRH